MHRSNKTGEKYRTLIVEDDLDVQLSAQMLLKKHNHKTASFANPREALRSMQTTFYDLVLLDMNFSKGETSGKEGLFWLNEFIKLQPLVKVVMITAYGDIDLAIKAIKAGAADFVLKPWQNEKFIAVISSVLQYNDSTNNTSETEENIMLGNSPAMKKVLSLIDKVASTDTNVLILGENGTGKDLVAKAIHKKSHYAQQKFCKVDMGAIAESLFESELFGHTKGAFTDAREDRLGWFEAAHNGTLFLDEIGNISQPVQSKLLNAIQNKQIVKVGSTKPIPVSIRLICATNMPLYEMALEGQFRKDLLYRINTVEIQLPSLKERKEDIPLLATHFLNVFARKYEKENISLGEKALEALIQYSWPGNIRELQHAMERAVILSESEVLQPEDFSFNNKSNNIIKNETLNLEDLERTAIKDALLKFQGNISHAARELGLTRAALYRRLEKYGI